MKTYIVTVSTQRGPYEVRCHGKKDLDKYTKALKEQWPYFRLLLINPESPTNRQPNHEVNRKEA